jgi:hypothetical protein
MSGFRFNNREGKIQFGDITVLDVNHLPGDQITLVADAVTGPEDQVLTGNVLTNDFTAVGNLVVSQFTVAGVVGIFAAGALATITGVGSLRILATGAWTFSPAPNYRGNVPLVTYQATNGDAVNQTTLSITITPVQDAPTASTDSVTASFNSPVTFSPILNDVDPDADVLTLYEVNGEAPVEGNVINVPNGTVTIGANNVLTFTPTPGYSGTFSFPYSITDGVGQASSTITITVLPTLAANGSATTFDSIYEETFALNSTQDVITREVLVKPTVKSTSTSDFKYTDPAFGTKVFMVTDVTDTADTVGYIRNDYSKRQCFNCDSTRFVATAQNSWWHLYDANTFAHIDVPGGVNGRMPTVAADAEIVWHPTDPHKFWFNNRGLNLFFQEIDIRTGEISPLFSFEGRMPPGFQNATRLNMGGEGRPSADGRFWCLQARGSDDSYIGVITYDRETDTILDYVVTNRAIDWAGVSHSGAWAVLGGKGGIAGNTMELEAGRDITQFAGTRAYPIDAISGSVFTVLDQSGQHGDLAVDVNGRDVWVSASYSPFMDMLDGDLYFRDIETGVPYIYEGLSAYAPGGNNAMHFSGCHYGKPGWALISYNAGGTPASWRNGTIMLIELTTESPRAYRLVHHRTDSGEYWATPFATANRDLTRILFGSDFHNSGMPYPQLMIGLPSWAVPTAGTYPPTKLTDPEIGGLVSPGGTLTRTAGTYDSTPVATVTGKWQISTNSGSSWTDITGASSETYVIPGGITNGTMYRWREMAANANGFAAALSNALTVAPISAPVNLVAPSITNGRTDVLSVGNRGSWSANPTPTFTYMWQRDVAASWTDTAFTTRSALLSPAGVWRLRVSASNSEGGPIVAFSNNATISEPVFEPIPTNVVNLTAANDTSIEMIDPNWDGITSNYVIVDNMLRNGTTEGYNTGPIWLTTSGGNNQAFEVTLAAPANIGPGGNHLTIMIHTTGVSTTGYKIEIRDTQLRLYRADNFGEPAVGPLAHNVDLLTTDMTLRMTSYYGRIRAYINGSATPIIDYTDADPITGGYVGLFSYPGADSSRVRISHIAHGVS